jgi:hypothetical protein
MAAETLQNAVCSAVEASDADAAFEILNSRSDARVHSSIFRCGAT